MFDHLGETLVNLHPQPFEVATNPWENVPVPAPRASQEATAVVLEAAQVASAGQQEAE